MSKNSKYLLIVVVVISMIAHAQEHGSSTQPSVGGAELAINNPLQSNVNFGLSCGGGAWTQFTLNSGAIGRYNCPQNQPMSIAITTQGFAPVLYDLPYQNRYEFFGGRQTKMPATST